MQRTLYDNSSILACPRCSGGMDIGVEMTCPTCNVAYPIEDGIPLLFEPHFPMQGEKDVTEEVKAFYEKTPFPDYDDVDSLGMLMTRARESVFARLLDEQLPQGIRILECGCGTGQLSIFLAIGKRSVFGTDMCIPSLRLARDFQKKSGVTNLALMQMNLFKPAFRKGSFDLVISNGVLHHTSDPRLGLRTIASLVRPGGHLIVGLYHRYDRLGNDLRRLLFRIRPLPGLDPRLRRIAPSSRKKTAWFEDQYRNPHESKHTILQVVRWLRAEGFEFINSLPETQFGSSLSTDEYLFFPKPLGATWETMIVEALRTFIPSREGGLFIVIARRPH